MKRVWLFVLFAPLAVIGVGAPFSSCTTDSETPNADYGTGVTPGKVDNPCRSNHACEDDTLTCILDNDPNDPGTCRLRCRTNDPQCDVDYRCIPLTVDPNDPNPDPTRGACIPESDVGGPCGICKDPLRCVGGTCLRECEELPDGGGFACADGGTGVCDAVDGGPEVCLL